MHPSDLAGITCQIPAPERKAAGELIVAAEKLGWLHLGVWVWCERHELHIDDIAGIDPKGQLRFVKELEQ